MGRFMDVNHYGGVEVGSILMVVLRVGPKNLYTGKMSVSIFSNSLVRCAMDSYVPSPIIALRTMGRFM